MDIEHLAANPDIMYDRIDQLQDHVRNIALNPANSNELAAASAGLRALFAGVVIVSGPNVSALAGGYFSAFITLRNLASNPMLEAEVGSLYADCLRLVENGGEL